MRLTHFGGVQLPTASEELDTPVNARSALVELPNGAYDMDGSRNVLKPVTLNRTFKITASLDTVMSNLTKAMVAGRKVLKAIRRDNSTTLQTFAKLTELSRPRDAGDVNVQRVRATFVQDYPYWLHSSDEPHYLDHGDVLDDGWNLDGNYTTITIDADQETPSISNGGDLPIQRGKLVVIPGSASSFDSLTILNKANMMELRYLGAVDYPQVLVIDLLAKRATVDMVNSYDQIQLPQGQFDWMQLETGTNDLQLDLTGRAGTITAYWHWSRHYA